jgi:adenylate cyclase
MKRLHNPVYLTLMLMGAFITYLIYTSYRQPLVKMRQAADRVRAGDFDVNVPVYSNDEVGNLGEAFNEMVVGLREKEFIKNTFGKMVDTIIECGIVKLSLFANIDSRKN